MGPIGCPKTSIRNYHYSLRNNPEKSSSHLLCDGRLKSRESFHVSFFSQNITRTVKSNEMRWVGHVACVGKNWRTYRILIGKTEEKNHMKTMSK
jgi:hypothetical protein